MKHTLVILLAVAVVSVSANLSKNVVSNSVSTNKNRRHISSPNIIAKKVSKSPSAVATATTGGSSDLSSSILNLAKTILGAGVLSLPSGIALFSDSKQATIPAIALLAFMGLASAYSFSSVGKACQLHGVGSFAEAFAKSLGLSSGRAISTVITLKTFFACLAYSIIIGDSFSQIFRSFAAPLALQSRTNVIVGSAATVLLPLCLLKQLDALKYTSMLGLGGVLYCASFVVLRFFDGSYRPGGKFYSLIDASLRPSFGTQTGSMFQNSNIFLLIGMISSAYVAHYNAPKFWKELKQPTRPRYNLVVTSAFLVSFLVYVTVVLAGFLTFGGHSSGFILNNYASADSLATVARLAIGAGIVFGYPLTFSALRDGAMELMNIKTEDKNKAFLPTTLGLLGVLTASALVLKNVGAVVSLGGALIGAMLIFTIPAIMNIRNFARFATPGTNTSLELVANYAMAVMGAVMAVIGVYANQRSMGGH